MSHHHLIAEMLRAFRPGGGQSYSGGGGGGGGGGYSGGGGSSSSSGDNGAVGQLVVLLVEVCFRYPPVGITVLSIIAISVIVAKMRNRSSASSWRTFDESSWSTRSVVPPPAPAPIVSPRRRLAEIRQFDPGFSTVIFEDFLYALYARVAEARGDVKKLNGLNPWLGAYTRASIGGSVPAKAIVIGAFHYKSVLIASDSTTVVVQFEANYAEGETTYYTTETWSLARARKAVSRPPDRARDFGCPNCGAALTELRGSTCQHCQAVIDTGDFDWIVQSIRVDEKAPRGPALTGDVPEVGTDWRTIVAEDWSARIAEMMARDPAFAISGFEARVKLIFAELQVAWSTRDWKRARPFVSDGLFQMQLYWMETYQRAALTNQTANAAVSAIEYCAVESDAHYDAVTVRVRASSLDFTTRDADGKVVAGSKTRPRAYTEYWTLIRGSGRKGAASVEKTCPNCGAELKINMAGACEFCQARVGSGDFDWVLSRIEQDESYTG